MLIVPVIVITSLTIGYYVWSKFLSVNDTEFGDLIVQSAVRAPLRISITERGQLDSMQNATMSSTVEGSTTIISIVPEGTKALAPVRATVEGTVTRIDNGSKTFQKILVTTPEGSEAEHQVTMGEHTQVMVEVGEKVIADEMLAGDLICELNSAEMREKLKQQQIQLTQADAALAQAIENLEIQKTQNESDMAAAELNLKLGRLDLEKYQQGEYEQQVNEIAGEITLAQEELTRAQENYAFSKRIAKKGYRSQNDLEADRIATTKAEISLRVAQEKQKVLKTYTYTRTVAELEANAKELALELDRVKRKGISAITQFEADVDARKLTAEVEKDKYERLLNQIKGCKLYATQAGEVVYANNTSSRSRSDTSSIEEGATVRERQAIIKLPDLDFMKVDARIHESRINQVSAGQTVQVRVDAFPEETFEGVVDSVSSVPSSTNWYNRDLKEYDAVVKITESGEKSRRLRPGLTAAIEIIVKHREDVLQVPVQSVVSVMHKHLAFVKTAAGVQQREVVIGDSNESAIEILDGIQDGEEVVMSPRSHFSEKIAEYEKTLIELESKQAATAPQTTSATKPTPSNSAPEKKTTAKIPTEKKPASNSGADRFKQMDKNGDGKLSKNELPAPMQSHFDKLDVDKDGFVTQAELKALMKRPGS